LYGAEWSEKGANAGGDASIDTGEGIMLQWLAATGEGCADGALVARSKYSQNFASLTCHPFHSSSDAKRLYRMLLRNSTSITWISPTDIPETSAQVLFVYVLSSRTLNISGCAGQMIEILTFISQHQCHRQKPIFTPRLTFHGGIQRLQSIYEK
jgi:hypothetical protein